MRKDFQTWHHKKEQINEKNTRYYYSFSFLKEVISVAVLSQIRLIDARRLSRHIGTMTSSDFVALTEKLKDLLP